MIPTLNQVVHSQETLKSQLPNQKFTEDKSVQVTSMVKTEELEAKTKIARTTVEKIMSSEINITFHEKNNRMIIKLVDPKTKEVLKEVPPEKLVDMLASICETAGLLIDKKV